MGRKKVDDRGCRGLRVHEASSGFGPPPGKDPETSWVDGLGYEWGAFL